MLAERAAVTLADQEQQLLRDARLRQCSGMTPELLGDGAVAAGDSQGCGDPLSESVDVSRARAVEVEGQHVAVVLPVPQ